MNRKRVAIGVIVGLVVVAALIAWNELGNQRARAELTPACECARASAARTLVSSDELFLALFDDDAGEVRAFLRDEVDEVCDGLEEALAPGHWNLGRDWSPPVDEQRAARVNAALGRARPRCPRIYAELLGNSSGGGLQASTFCDGLFEGIRPTEQAPLRITTWRWPELVESSMCLEEERSARGNAP